MGTPARRRARSNARPKSRWLVKRARPRLAYFTRSHCTGGRCCSGWVRGVATRPSVTSSGPSFLHHWWAPGVAFSASWLTSDANSGSLRQIGDWCERKQRATGRADLNGGVQLRTNPALEAWRPAAVVDLDLIQGVLPVLPQPLPIQAGIQMLPGQHLGVVALARGVPVKIDSGAIQASLGATSPTLVREVLAPAVESAAIPPNCFDDRAHTAIAATQQSFDDARLPIVITEADRPAILPITTNRIPQLDQPRVHGFMITLRCPLERGMRFGHEATDAHCAADIAPTADSSTGSDHSLGELPNGEYVFVGLGRQATHEIQLDLPPAVRVRRRHGSDQILLSDHLVDHFAHPFGAALGREGKPGAPAVAGQLVGEVDVERVHPCAWQRERNVAALITISKLVSNLGNLGMITAGQAQQPDLLQSGGLDAALHHGTDDVDAAFPDRPSDHSRLAEPAAPSTAPEDLHGIALMHRLGERHEWLLGVRPVVQIHQRVLFDAERYARPIRRHPVDPAVRQVVDVVKLRHVNPAAGRESQQQAIAAARPTLGLPFPDDCRDRQRDLLAVAQHRSIQEICDRLGVECRVPACQNDGVVLPALSSADRYSGQVQLSEHVGVAELGSKAQSEDIELSDRSVRIQRELWHAVLAHQRLHVGPYRVRPLGKDPVLLVENLVQDRDALIGQPYLVRIRIAEAPAHLDRLPVLRHAVQFPAHVLDGFADPREQRFEAREYRSGTRRDRRHDALSVMATS